MAQQGGPQYDSFGGACMSKLHCSRGYLTPVTPPDLA